MEINYLAFAFSPFAFFLMGWYGGRSDVQRGRKAAFVSICKVFFLMLLLNFALIGLLSLFS